MPGDEGNSRVNDSSRMDAGTEGSFPEPGAVTHSAESDFDIPEVGGNHLDYLNDLVNLVLNPLEYLPDGSSEDWKRTVGKAVDELTEALSRRSLVKTDLDAAPSPATTTGHVPTNYHFDPQDNWSDTGDQSKKRSSTSSPSPQRPPKAQRRGQLPTCRDEDNSNENPSTERIDFKTQIGPPKNRVTRTTRTYADRTRHRN